MSKLTKKPPSLRRKFSFELPRLKIGSSKAEERTPKDKGASGADSPPPTPKSVRPPLSPKSDHQLRLACAYILQDFKPSHQLYEEQYGKTGDGKRQSTEVIKPSADLKIEPADSLIISKPRNRKQPETWKIESKEIEPLALDVPPMKPTIKSQAFFEGLHLDSSMLDAGKKQDKSKSKQHDDEEIMVDLSNFNPPIASQAFFEGVDLDRIRKATAAAIEHPLPPISTAFAEPKVASPLKRSFSTPAHSRTISVEHSRKLPRADSVQTSVSTPRTEHTEASLEHSRNASTAPTSAVISPATHSMRGSAQAACSSSEKFLTTDVEWMREELERHRKAQDEARAQQELENQVLSSLGMETLSAHSKKSSTSSAPARQRKHKHRPSTEDERFNALPKSGETKRQMSIQERRNVPPVPQLDGRQSRELARSESRRHRSTPRCESAHELEMLRPESRQSQRNAQENEDPEPSTRRRMSQEIKGYFKRSSAPTSPGSATSRASSSSRRIVQVYGPAEDGTRPPPASLESSKLQSRARSIESIRSAAAAVLPSSDSGSINLRTWRSYRTHDDSANPGTGSSSTQLSKRHSRDFSFEFSQAADGHRKSKASVNLNRELPPLPSLDQWKSEEPTKSKHIASMISPRSATFRLSEAASASEPNLLEKPEFLSPHVGSHTSATSQINSIYSRYAKFPEIWSPDDAPPYTPLPTDADFPHSGTHERFNLRETVASSLRLPIDDPTPLPVVDSLPLLVPPSSLTDEKRQQRIPSEYMFRANFGKVTVPLAPPPIPADVVTEVKTIRRKTEDMFLPDLDARARTAAKGDTSTPTSNTGKADNTVSDSRSVPKKQPTVLRKQNSQRNQISAPLSAGAAPSHAKTPSEQITNFSRKPSTDNYSRLYDMGYRNIVHIQPVRDAGVQREYHQIPVRKESKRWWKRGTSKRERAWTDDGVRGGSQPSLVLMDENAVAQF